MPLVSVIADRIGVPYEVEPPRGELLCMPRRGQQSIDQPLVAVGGWVGEVGIDIGRRGGQPGQIEGESPNKRDVVGIGRRLEPLGLEPGQHEPVDPV